MKIKEITPVSDDMYPLYWTTSKEGVLCVIVMSLN